MGVAAPGSGVFVSHYVHSLDPKKRLTIPAEWREQITASNSLYVLPDVHHRCLCVFPAGEIVHRLQRIRSHSIGDAKVRQFARVLGSQSHIVSWDSQGRIRVKDELLALARLEDQVELVGAFDRFELWNPDLLRESGGMDRGNLQEAAEYVGF
jgi:MraZ protein